MHYYACLRTSFVHLLCVCVAVFSLFPILIKDNDYAREHKIFFIVFLIEPYEYDWLDCMLWVVLKQRMKKDTFYET
jgi:hypothetical protein